MKIIVYTELTTGCQNRCPFCALPRVGRAGLISRDVREGVLRFLRAFPERSFLVYTHLVGEPLLYPGLEDYVKELSMPHVEAWVCTNGISLTEDRLLKLSEAGLEHLWLTLFGTSEEDYLCYTGTDNFKAAYASLHMVMAHSQLFREIQIVSFSRDVSAIEQEARGHDNVRIQSSRPVEAWDLEEPSALPFICFSIHGDVTLDWKDCNFERSVGNVLSTPHDQLMDAYDSHERLLSARRERK